MKKTFFVMLLIAGIVMSAYGQRYYEVRQDDSCKVLFVHEKKFLGKREEVLRLDTFDVTQPNQPELLMLPMTGIDRTEIWVYQLFRFINNHWEYITDFPGDSEPNVVLNGGSFTATQICCEPERTYRFTIYAMVDPGLRTRYWVLKETAP